MKTRAVIVAIMCCCCRVGADERSNNPLQFFRAIQFAGRNDAATVSNAVKNLARTAKTNPLVCIELGRRLTSFQSSMWSYGRSIEAAAFGNEGFCRGREGDILLALSDTDNEMYFLPYLRKEDFLTFRADIERMMPRVGVVSLGRLARTAARLGAKELLVPLAKKVAVTWDSDDPIVYPIDASRGTRWSISVAGSLLQLGAAEHADVPEVRAALERCRIVEESSRPRRGSDKDKEEAAERDSVMAQVINALDAARSKK